MIDVFSLKIKIKLETWNIRATKALFLNINLSTGEGNDLLKATDLGYESCLLMSSPVFFPLVNKQHRKGSRIVTQ